MDPLADLKDIHLPDPVSVWPLALGWWLLVGLLVILLVSTFLLYRKYQSQGARRQAKQAIKMADSPQQMLVILKSLCLSYFPRDQIAALHGEPWEQFLLQQLKPRHQAQFQRLSSGLFAQLYTPDFSLALSGQLKICVKYWIQHAVLTRKKQEAQP